MIAQKIKHPICNFLIMGLLPRKLLLSFPLSTLDPKHFGSEKNYGKDALRRAKLKSIPALLMLIIPTGNPDNTASSYKAHNARRSKPDQTDP